MKASKNTHMLTRAKTLNAISNTNMVLEVDDTLQDFSNVSGRGPGGVGRGSFHPVYLVERRIGGSVGRRFGGLEGSGGR